MSSEQRHPFTVNWVGTFSVNSVLLLVLAKCISGVVLSPDSREARRQAALKLAPKGDLLQAATQLESLVKERPAAFRARLALGIVAQHAGHAETAEEEVRAAIKLNPDSPAAWYQLGSISSGQGLYKSAIYYFRKALSLNPSKELSYH